MLLIRPHPPAFPPPDRVGRRPDQCAKLRLRALATQAANQAGSPALFLWNRHLSSHYCCPLVFASLTVSTCLFYMPTIAISRRHSLVEAGRTHFSASIEAVSLAGRINMGELPAPENRTQAALGGRANQSNILMTRNARVLELPSILTL